MWNLFTYCRSRHHDHDAAIARIERVERDIEHTLREILHQLREQSRVAHRSSITLVNSKGESTTMPMTVNVNDTPGKATYAEFNAAGAQVPPTRLVQYASDTPSVATVDANTGALVYVGPGNATISANDGGFLPASDVLTVTPATQTAVSSTLTLTPGQ